MEKKIEIGAIVAAATIGQGVFALPYVIQRSGWAVSLIWFAGLIAAVAFAHAIYLRVLAAEDEKMRLLGLARRHLGIAGFSAGLAAIVVGLLLGFVAYLVLGMRFLSVLIPGIQPSVALGVFWAVLALLIWRSGGRIAWLEVGGIALVACAILFIFFTGRPDLAFANIPAASPQEFFLPFGAVLFALAGWTSVEQVYEIVRGKGVSHPSAIFWTLAGGTAFAALLYWLFALGAIGGAGRVAADTVSGIAGWPVWRKEVLAVVGLAAACAVSIPTARELRNVFEKDLGWSAMGSRAVIVLVPLAAVLAGFTNFLAIVSIAGGVFIAGQYLLIVAVGRRALVLTLWEKVFLDIVAVVFAAAAVYEIATFVVH